MAHVAATTDIFLLKFLQLRGGWGREAVDLREIAADLARLQDVAPEVRIYDFVGADPQSDPNFVRDVQYLAELGFVRYLSDNPHLKLTEWGTFFAEMFELPPTVAGKLAGRTGRVVTVSA